MAKEIEIWDIVSAAGYTHVENQAIIVKYTPQDLHNKITSFFSMDFFALQICQEAIILIPFSRRTMGLKKKIELEIPISSIKSVEIEEDRLNYIITIKTEESKVISLTAQQKNMSAVRSAVLLSSENTVFSSRNWHTENLDETLEALKNLNE